MSSTLGKWLKSEPEGALARPAREMEKTAISRIKAARADLKLVQPIWFKALALNNTTTCGARVFETRATSIRLSARNDVVRVLERHAGRFGDWSRQRGQER